jgi:hypothetical protein
VALQGLSVLSNFPADHYGQGNEIGRLAPWHHDILRQRQHALRSNPREGLAAAICGARFPRPPPCGGASVCVLFVSSRRARGHSFPHLSLPLRLPRLGVPAEPLGVAAPDQTAILCPPLAGDLGCRRRIGGASLLVPAPFHAGVTNLSLRSGTSR